MLTNDELEPVAKIGILEWHENAVIWCRIYFVRKLLDERKSQCFISPFKSAETTLVRFGTVSEHLVLT